MKLHSISEDAPLVFQEGSCCLTVLRGQMSGILGEALTVQNMLQNNQHSQIFLSIRTKKGRYPTDGLGPIRIRIAERLQFAQVVPRSVTRFIEREIDY